MAMDISHSPHLSSEPRRERDNFTGAVAQRLLHEHPGAVRVLIVGFDPGARTHWHTHEGGQVLHILSGRGQAQSEGAAIVELREGDVVVAAAGEKHWHGAAAGSPMTHLAVSAGDTRWLGEAEVEPGLV